MALDNMEHNRRTIVNAHTMQHLPTTRNFTSETTEEPIADPDEPPDEKHTPKPKSSRSATQNASAFEKSTLPPSSHKQSLLTQALNTSDSDQNSEDDDTNITSISRGMSSVSIWSNTSAGSTAELTSDGGFTSPGTRNSSPSPPLPPASFRGLPALFSKPSSNRPVSIRSEDDHIGPTQRTPLGPNEGAVEAGLGRKRCITFACGRKDTPTPVVIAPVSSPPDVVAVKETAIKRPCTIRFACPNRVSTEQPSRHLKPHLHRQPSPAPRLLKGIDPAKSSPRSHRGSDSTVRNASPRTMRKPAVAPRPRRDSDNSDIGRSEATRFHEFASSEEEMDEWVLESTCHRSRLTVSDTLRVENKLRKLGEEVEEEAIEEEAALDEDEDNVDDDEDEDEDDLDVEVEDLDNGDDKLYEEESSDDGFKTDDEDGFAGSDDESDAESDYAWWAPRRSDGSTSVTQADHIRPSGRRSFSDSSVGSFGSGPSLPHGLLPSNNMKRRKPKPVNIRPKSPELPDSTDFVCGTLDEDRPLEEAYMSALEARRIAKHRFTPQDIDPSFPQSDPEMIEEDEDEDEDEHLAPAEESDQHLMMVGSLEPTDIEARGRHRPSGAHSPDHITKRMKSPPPPSRRSTYNRSPPPHRLFDSPPKRLRSPPPTRRLRSPPPTRRPSFAKSPKINSIHFMGLAGRPQPLVAFSLPRTPTFAVPPPLSEEEEETSKEQLPSRGAIEIKAGLERKRQRRQEKLYQKHCRKEAQREKDKRFRPGTGCKKMREIGLEAISRGRQHIPFPTTKEAMILSL